MTVIETLISLGLIAILFSILVPALSSARVVTHRDQCQNNQRLIGEAWNTYLEDHEQTFPLVPVQPGWYYGGVRFSGVDRIAFPDLDRPLTSYMHLHRTGEFDQLICCCPADRGVTDPQSSLGTGSRTAFRSFGTSYRANAELLDSRLTNVPGEPRGLHRYEITTPTSRMVLMGDPIWYEVAEVTGREANWHDRPAAGNLLFLDGSVRFVSIKPRTDRNQAIVFDPAMPGSVPRKE